MSPHGVRVDEEAPAARELASLAVELPQSTVSLLRGPGATSLALALLATQLRRDTYAAAIGLPHLGLEAAAELGIALEHLALCPSPGRAWPEATALALEACPVVLLAPTTACTEAMAARVAARVRERRARLLLLQSPAGGAFRWPGVRDLVLECDAPAWSGLANGPGRLDTRELLVHLGGHRARGARTYRLLLPARSGTAALLGGARRLAVAEAG